MGKVESRSIFDPFYKTRAPQRADLFRLIPSTEQRVNYDTETTVRLAEQRQKVVALAKQILPPELLSSTNEHQIVDEAFYQQAKSYIVDLYLLTSPCLNPDQHSQILAAETRHGVQHIGRSQQGQLVWSPEFSDRQFGLRNLPAAGFPDEIKRDIDKWWLVDESLLDHTLIATFFVRRLVAALQEKAAGIGETERSDIQQRVLAFNPHQLMLKILFHDWGRIITYHRLEHEFETQELLAEIGVPKELREEPPVIQSLVQELLPTIQDISANLELVLFYVCDALGKGVNYSKTSTTKVRRPAEMIEIIRRKHERYSGGEFNRHTKDAYYDLFESSVLGRIMFLLQDDALGFGLSIGEFEQVLQQVDQDAQEMRRELFSLEKSGDGGL